MRLAWFEVVGNNFPKRRFLALLFLLVFSHSAFARFKFTSEEYKDGHWYREGSYPWADGRKYVGEFKDWDFSKGTYTQPDGYQYEGAWECNTMEIVNYMATQNFSEIKHPNTHDPTFLNQKFKHLKNSIFIHQC